MQWGLSRNAWSADGLRAPYACTLWHTVVNRWLQHTRNALHATQYLVVRLSNCLSLGSFWGGNLPVVVAIVRLSLHAVVNRPRQYTLRVYCMPSCISSAVLRTVFCLGSSGARISQSSSFSAVFCWAGPLRLEGIRASLGVATEKQAWMPGVWKLRLGGIRVSLGVVTRE